MISNQELLNLISDSKEFLEQFIRKFKIPNVNDCDDLVKNYVDFYITRKKIYEEQSLEKHFSCFGTAKKEKGERRSKTVQVVYFGKKLQKKLTDYEIEKYHSDFELFIRYFKIYKNFYEINTINNEVELIYKER